MKFNEDNIGISLNSTILAIVGIIILNLLLLAAGTWVVVTIVKAIVG